MKKKISYFKLTYFNKIIINNFKIFTAFKKIEIK